MLHVGAHVLVFGSHKAEGQSAFVTHCTQLPVDVLQRSPPPHCAAVAHPTHLAEVGSEVGSQYGCGFAHAEPTSCQTPDAVQFCGCSPLHWCVPGLHATQAPFRHAAVLPEQATLPTQVPPAHVWGTRPLQRTADAVHPASGPVSGPESNPLLDPELPPVLDPELLPELPPELPPVLLPELPPELPPALLPVGASAPPLEPELELLPELPWPPEPPPSPDVASAAPASSGRS